MWPVSRGQAAPRNPTPAGFALLPSPLGLPHPQAATSVPPPIPSYMLKVSQGALSAPQQAERQRGVFPQCPTPKALPCTAVSCTHCFQWPQKATGLPGNHQLSSKAGGIFNLAVSCDRAISKSLTVKCHAKSPFTVWFRDQKIPVSVLNDIWGLRN